LHKGDAAPIAALDHAGGFQSVQLPAHGFQAQAQVLGDIGAGEGKLDQRR
jgi:hypothetical protein